MIRRRFLFYFLVATAFTITATVVFEVYTLKRTINHSVEQNLLFARSIAGFIGGAVEQEGHELAELARALPEETQSADQVRAALSSTRFAMLDTDGVAVFDERGTLIAHLNGPSGLMPPRVLLPALRHALETKGLVATDMWSGLDDKPRIGLVQPVEKNGKWRTVAASMRLDAAPFQRTFEYFLIGDRARMQLLDSRGSALYSTRPDERFRSAVHGTYFTDRVREGKPAQMQCHSCHTDPDEGEVRENEMMTVAPVPGTNWSVTVREGTRDLYQPMREMAYSSIALVSIIFGAFVGFFLMMSRHVLRPMRQLAEAAAAVAQGRDEPLLVIDARDEVGVLAESFETMRLRMKRATTASGRVTAVDVGDIDTKAKGGGDAVTEATATADGEGRRASLAAVAQSATFRQGLERTFGHLLDSFFDVHLVRSAVLVLDPDSLPGGLVATRGLDLSVPPQTLQRVLAEVRAGRELVLVGELAAHGVTIGETSGTLAFYVVDFQALDALQGELWIGLDIDETPLSRYLRLTLSLIAAQVRSVVERALLYDQLRAEHDQKNRMVRHLFEAENEERKRIAREIHDETAQALTALLLLFETFPTGGDEAAQQAKLELAKDRVSQILDATDRLARRLRPAALDDLGLVEAVRTTGHNLLVSANIDFHLDAPQDQLGLPKEIEEGVYRVLQEATTNVARHSGAKAVRAGLAVRGDRLVAFFEDDGQGMDLSWLGDASARPRWGLLGMRERVIQLGGAIRFSSSKEGGLRIDLEVPVALSTPRNGAAANGAAANGAAGNGAAGNGAGEG